MLEDRFAQHDKIPGDTYVEPYADYQMRTWDYRVRPSADGASGAYTITLPSVAEAKGRLYSIVCRSADGSNTVTIADKGDSEDWSDIVLDASHEVVILYSDGLKWDEVAGPEAIVLGVADNYKIARGTITPTTASDTVVTGLTTVVAAVASLKDAPTLTHMLVAADIGDQAGTPAAGSILIKSYKPVSSADVTPTAATTPWGAVDWIAVGV